MLPGKFQPNDTESFESTTSDCHQIWKGLNKNVSDPSKPVSIEFIRHSDQSKTDSNISTSINLGDYYDFQRVSDVAEDSL